MSRDFLQKWDFKTEKQNIFVNDLSWWCYQSHQITIPSGKKFQRTDKKFEEVTSITARLKEETVWNNFYWSRSSALILYPNQRYHWMPRKTRAETIYFWWREIKKLDKVFVATNKRKWEDCFFGWWNFAHKPTRKATILFCRHNQILSPTSITTPIENALNKETIRLFWNVKPPSENFRIGMKKKSL